MSLESNDTSACTASGSQSSHSGSQTSPGSPPAVTRQRSGSLGQLFISSDANPFTNLNIRRGSLSKLFMGPGNFDKDHNYLGQIMNDPHDDLDTCSQVSDSAFSDVSHNTQVSSDLTPSVKDPDIKLLKRNASANDLPSTSAQIHMQSTKEKSQQRRLSHSMVWNWVKSHQVRIDENTTLTEQTVAQQPVDHNEKHFAKSRKKISMRDLNAIGPSGW